jgi:hypothetical protein
MEERHTFEHGDTFSVGGIDKLRGALFTVYRVENSTDEREGQRVRAISTTGRKMKFSTDDDGLRVHGGHIYHTDTHIIPYDKLRFE